MTRSCRRTTGILAALCGVAALGIAAASAQTLKLAHVNPADWRVSQKGAAGDVFKNLVEAESGGRIKVQLYPASQLGGEVELVAQVQSGALELAMVSGVFGNYCKEAAVLDLPFLFPSAVVAWRTLDGPFGKKLADHCLTKTGLRILAYGEIGFRNFTNSVREIRGPADLKGLKIRVQQLPLYVEMMKGLGAIPTPVAWPETPGALKTKVVDGQENPVAIILSNKFHEMQQFMTLDQHVYGTDFLLINEPLFARLSPEDRAMVKRNAIIAQDVGRGVQQLTSAAGVAELARLGMKIYKPTAAELAQFRAAAQPPVLAWLKGAIEAGWVESAQQAVAAVEAELAN
ncbi:MAG: DctP family TRAP transporter solute-binding subunit [Alphaproteobacteria bacterium]|nr:DctP family TRAP transporter solute-binding subunit [Alphaproteobacteria bacterium]